MTYTAQIKFYGKPKKKGYPSGSARFRANPVRNKETGKLALAVLSPAWCLATAGCPVHEPNGVSKRTKLIHMLVPNGLAHGSAKAVTVPVNIPGQDVVTALAEQLHAKGEQYHGVLDDVWPYGYEPAHIYKSQTTHIRYDSDDKTVTEHETPVPARFVFGAYPIPSFGGLKTPVEISCTWDDDGQATWKGLKIYLPDHVVKSEYPDY